MNEFEIYKHLCDMKDIAACYPEGKDFAKKIGDTADRMSSKLYRVAVIGEFKRGKSSLINALVGSSILPTDILPMTAVITHLIYGEEKKIIIRFKDGRVQESSVEQLADFATKYDEAHEKTARSIDEIIVHYPSVYCKNHIEILDTPGMNDNDEMTDVTLSVLGNIDAAVMVISATMPFSESEQKLVLRMIEEQGIHHVVFVVTHIDKVSDEAEEQDRIIELIRSRITTNLLERAQSRFADNEALSMKAHSILSEPDIFGVSSVLAMQGFTYDDKRKLRASRFPVFKQELLELLTAAQSMDVGLNAADYADYLSEKLPEWKENAVNNVQEEIKRYGDTLQRITQYRYGGKKELINILVELDKLLGNGSMLFTNNNVWVQQCVTEVKGHFITALASIRKDTDNNSDITKALQAACDELGTGLLPNDRPTDFMSKIQSAFEKYAETVPDKAVAEKMFQQWLQTEETPKLNLSYVEVLPEFPKDVEAIEYIRRKLNEIYQNYARQVGAQIAKFRATMFAIDKEMSVTNAAELDGKREAALKSLKDIEYMHNKNIEAVKRIKRVLTADKDY